MVRWHLCALRSSPVLPSKLFQRSSDYDNGIFSSFLGLRHIIERVLLLRLSPPDDRGCDVLGFVPAESVSSSSTHMCVSAQPYLAVCVSYHGRYPAYDQLYRSRVPQHICMSMHSHTFQYVFHTMADTLPMISFNC